MKKILLGLCLLIPALAFACPEHVKLSDASIRATAFGQKTSAAYFEIENTGNEPISLLKVTTPIAEKAELHEMVMVGGIAKMQHLDALVIEPHTKLKLMPGGLHVMLLGVREHLKPGMLIPLTLHFSEGQIAEIDVTVQDMRK